ncbi:hypothetical protein N7456_006852 [Penicillium angulare]|uniref:Uncharacterized protein n=1 Tax=Penicillium angulare TaxID=116970 RepID=A0A9W9KC14_9EURO|nr:hypothetical protein N7456_006852 [Penicillium angulare]
MPKTRTTAREAPVSTRILRSHTGTSEFATQTLHSQCTAASRPHPYTPKSTQANVMKEVSTTEIIHANRSKSEGMVSLCLQQLQLRHAQEKQFKTERAQLQTKIRQLSLQNQESLEETRKFREWVVSLQQQLDAANAEVRNRITRKEFEQTLSEIHAEMMSVRKTAARYLDKYHNE